MSQPCEGHNLETWACSLAMWFDVHADIIKRELHGLRTRACDAVSWEIFLSFLETSPSSRFSPESIPIYVLGFVDSKKGLCVSE